MTPQTDIWRPMAAGGAPPQLRGHTAVWTGEQMLVWGGDEGDDTGRSVRDLHPAGQ